MDEDRDRDVSTTAWIVAAVAAIAVVLLIAFARRDPGFDDRVPDPPDASAVAAVELQPEVHRVQ
jgi:hypothetical protein